MQLTVRAVSKLFKVSEKTVYRWIEQDDLPASLIDGHHGFNRGELVEWATARHISVPDELFKGTDKMVAALPSLVEALQAGGIFHQLKGADKASVLRAAVDAMPLPQEVDRHLLWQMLFARESLQSTGVGEGIAIPHVRNPMVLRVSGLKLENSCSVSNPSERIRASIVSARERFGSLKILAIFRSRRSMILKISR